MTPSSPYHDPLKSRYNPIIIVEKKMTEAAVMLTTWYVNCEVLVVSLAFGFLACLARGSVKFLHSTYVWISVIKKGTYSPILFCLFF